MTTPEVVKLADFGLSRGLQDGDYYVGQLAILCETVFSVQCVSVCLQLPEVNYLSSGWLQRALTSEDSLVLVMSGCLVSIILYNMILLIYCIVL